MKIISKTEAKKIGAPKFFTGIDCIRGHKSERYTNTGGCVKCTVDRAAVWNKKNKARRHEIVAKSDAKHCEARAVYRKEYEKANKERLLLSHAKYRAENKTKVTESKKLYLRNNPKKRAESQALYASRNKEKLAAKMGRIRARKRSALPSWLTDGERFFIDEIYSLAKERRTSTGVSWHVDHIIPLNGKSVCGLHVPANLQVIPAVENLQKSNKFRSEMT